MKEGKNIIIIENKCPPWLVGSTESVVSSLVAGASVPVAAVEDTVSVDRVVSTSAVEADAKCVRI